MVLLMVLAPAAGAVAPIVKVAPYTGTTSTAVTELVGFCGAAGGAVAKWAPTTGNVTGSSTAKAKGCSPWITTYVEAFSEHEVVVAIPFTVGANSLYNASVTFNWNLLSSLVVSAGKCPAATNYGSTGYDYVYCDLYSGWESLLSAQLWDATNNTQVSETYSEYEVENYTDNYTTNSYYHGTGSNSSTQYSCTTSTTYDNPSENEVFACAKTGADVGHASIWTNTSNWHSGFGTNRTLLTTHSYVIVLHVLFYAYAEMFADSSYYTGTTSGYFYFKSPASVTSSVVGTPSSKGWGISSVVITAVV